MFTALGCDPEVFLTNKESFVSVVGLVNGNKKNPWQIPGMPEGFTLQQDNVALEFGIPPAVTKKQWVEYITKVKLAGLRHLKGLSYSTESAVSFPVDQLQTAEANVFGCEPDFNAWTGQQNPSPKSSNPHLRSTGGHLHFAFTNYDKRSVVRACDLFHGLPSLIEDSKGNLRRQLYGMPGAYRDKPYGVEYRTLSNYWLFKTSLMSKIWDRAEQVFKYLDKYGDVFDGRIPEAIKYNNVALASNIMQYYGVK